MNKNFKLPSDVQKIIDAEIPKIIRKEMEMTIIEKVNTLKEQMIKEFNSHPITQEILAGPTSSNISGTLAGKGNLFSFIGFEEGSEPIKPIIDRFNEISVIFDSNIKSGIVFTVNFPEIQEIFALSPMPWATGRSWVKGIESGISGLGQYLYKANKSSRSGQGLQAKTKLNKGSKFKNTSYMSKILNKYKKEFLLIK